MKKTVVFLCALLASCTTPFQEEKSDNRVICWGDSLTSWGYPEVLASVLRSHGQELTVINRGVSGERTDEIAKRILSSPNDRGAGWSVIFMGQNGGWKDADDLARQFQEMVEYSKSENVIVITSHINSTNESEAVMMGKFGKRYINLRSISRLESFLTNAGLAVTRHDRDDIANGQCPSSLMVDGLHFNASGNLALATAVYRKMSELGLND